MTLNRVKQFADYKQFTISYFERAVGLSNGSIALQIKRGGTIGVDKIEKILQTYPELNPTWLLTGEGSMLRDGSVPALPAVQQPTPAPITRPPANEVERLRAEIAHLNRELGKKEGLLEAKEAQLEEAHKKVAELEQYKVLLAEALVELKQYQSIDRFLKNAAS